MTVLNRTAKSFLLQELLSGMWLTLTYVFRPKVTINYPYEKGPLSLLWLVLTAGALVAFGWLPDPSSAADRQLSEPRVVAMSPVRAMES